MANTFANAREALQDAEDEHDRLGRANVRMHISRTALYDRIERIRAQSDEEIQSAEANFEVELEQVKALHAARVRSMTQKHASKCMRLESERDDLHGLIEDNKLRRQKLRPQLSVEHGLHVRAATPSARRRTSRLNLAAHRPSSNDAASESEPGGPFDDLNGQDSAKIGKESNIETMTVSGRRFDPHGGVQTERYPANVHEVVRATPRGSKTAEEDPENITVHSKAYAATRRKRMKPQRLQSSGLRSLTQVAISTDDDWNYGRTFTSSRSRGVKIPTTPSHAYVAPTNYDEPEDEDSFSAQFSHIIALDGQWHEMTCYICNANAPQDRSVTGFFNGVISLLAHIRIAHGERPAQLEACIFRTFDWDDVGELRKGNDPFSGPIKQRRYRQNPSLGRFVQMNASSATTTTQNLAASGGDVSWVGRALNVSDVLPRAISPITPGSHPASFKPPVAQMTTQTK